MSFRLLHYSGLALICLGVERMDLRAEEPAPRPDAVSTNLTQTGRKSSPLNELEKGLKNPFDIFSAGPSAGKFDQSPVNYVPPAPVINNKKLRELMEKRAEETYLSPEESEDALLGNDWSQSGKNALDSSGRKLNSPLDRFYDRTGERQTAPTNQPSSLDLFGNRLERDEKSFKDPRSSSGLFGNELSALGRSFKQATNSSTEWGRPRSDNLKPRSFGDIFGLSPVEPDALKPRTSETRMDEFKRLLEGSAYAPPTDYGTTTRPSASSSLPSSRPAPGGVAPGPAWSSSLHPPASTSFADTPGLTGGPGKPAGVPDFAPGTPSLTPTAPIQQPKPPPPATFNVPKRRF